MQIKNSLLVMSQETFHMFINEECEVARKQPDPIAYLCELAEVDIEIDDMLLVGVIERWESREKYEEYMKGFDKTIEIFGDFDDEDWEDNFDDDWDSDFL